MSSTVYNFNDVDGDIVTIFKADIPKVGLGINIRTTYQGASLPLDEVHNLIIALQQAVLELTHESKESPGRNAD